MISIEDRELLKNDFPTYASNCLKIRTKSGDIQPFGLNESQRYLNKQINKQLKETSKIRAIILKGRQQGISTYIEGRLFWKVTHHAGRRAFILTHEAEATNNLFGMAQRYYELCPKEFKPSLGAASQRELSFDKIDSGYRVGTAGNKNTGRSSTIQYFHGSEAAFWDNASDIAKGALQAVPDEPGTEVFIESTANGKLNWFYEQWMLAQSGESDFIPIFIPWFWQKEYRAEPGKMMLSKEEIKIQKLYNLDVYQLAWRRKKIAELSSAGLRGEDEFRQEYPCSWEEAFEASTLGLAFEKLSRQKHMLPNFIPPDHWTKFTVMDWGTAKPFAVCWFTIADDDTTIEATEDNEEILIPRGALIMYREFYGWNGQPDIGCRMESRDVALRVLEIEDEGEEEMDYRVGDSAMWGEHDGPSTAERMFKATKGRYKMVKSRKGRQSNYQEVRARIAGEDDYPMFYVMQGCKHFWRTVPSLQLDEHHPDKGVATDQEDHIYDCVSYGCASRPRITTADDRIIAARNESKRLAQQASNKLRKKH